VWLEGGGWTAFALLYRRSRWTTCLTLHPPPLWFAATSCSDGVDTLALLAHFSTAIGSEADFFFFFLNILAVFFTLIVIVFRMQCNEYAFRAAGFCDAVG
jgi:hypothetical protein